MLVAIGLIWAGYGVASWGWVLVKGYNITLSEWFSPLHPYTWPAGDPPKVPLGQIFPGKGTATAGTPAPQTQTA